MLSKIIFLVSISAVLTANIPVTPADLRTFFDDIDTQVKALERETTIQILTNAVPLGQYISSAKTGIIANLTEAGLPYWATIRSLQEAAKAKGQNISPCTTVGNNALGNLNTSIITRSNQAYDRYNNTGNEILDASSSEAYNVIQELTVLEEVVDQCNDTTCATSLEKIITQFYSRATGTLSDAETKARTYVNDYLPWLLDFYRLDVNTYVSNYTIILNNVTACINNL